MCRLHGMEALDKGCLHLGGTEQRVGDCITLFRTACTLKLRNYLQKCPFNIFTCALTQSTESSQSETTEKDYNVFNNSLTYLCGALLTMVLSKYLIIQQSESNFNHIILNKLHIYSCDKLYQKQIAVHHKILLQDDLTYLADQKLLFCLSIKLNVSILFV